MKIPDNVSYILNKLEEAGFSAYIVGGCVRDSIMGNEPKDWDIATSAKPGQVKELFQQTYDTGLKHGTITVVLNALKYEITTFRIDGKYTDGRRPDSVTYSQSIKDDLMRRDFTINAIAYNPKEGFIDPFGGIQDIQKKVIRGVGDPDSRIKEDGLRMLRAVRFSAALGFTIAVETSKAIINNAGLIRGISAERVREELLGLLMSAKTSSVFTKEFIALAQHINSTLAKSISKNKDTLDKLLPPCKKDITLRLEVLIYFLNNQEAEVFLRQLKLSNHQYRSSINLHKAKNVTIDKCYYAVANAISKWGFDTFENYLYLQMLNCVVNDEDLSYTKEIEENYRLIIDNNLPIFIKDLAINGYDLNKEFNISGEIIGKTLNNLLDFVHTNPYKNTHEVLLREAYYSITKGPAAKKL